MLSKGRIIAGLGFSLALIGGASAQSKVTAVKVNNSTDGVTININGQNLSTPKTVRSADGKKVTFVFNASLSGKAGYQRVRKDDLKYITYGWQSNKPPQARVSLYFDKAQSPTLTQTGSGWVASWGNTFVAKQTAKSKDPLDHMPPLEPAYKSANPIMQLATAPKEATYLPVVAPMEAKVTLDFSNTDVVQILKALALQASVNIVTSPDVTGKLSVTLDKVSLSDALDLITTLSGLKYAKIGKTFVVTTASKYTETIRQVSGNEQTVSETRVVPIYSGQGTQIKAAVLKALPLDTVKGQFELLLPSDDVSVRTTDARMTKDEDKGDGKGSAGTATSAGGTVLETSTGGSKTTEKDLYVVVIGSPSRMQEVERFVRAVDEQISRAMGINYPTSNSVVKQTYFVQGGTAEDLINALGAKNNKIGSVDVAATPKGSSSRQSVVVTGREDEVKRLMDSMAQLDASDVTLNDFLVYDVKFADPRSLREELIAQLPGLRASIPPASAGNPKLYVPGDQKKSATETVGADGKTADAGNQAKTTAEIKGDQGTVDGLGQPFSDVEDVAYPMRLVLRGSARQIEEARKILQIMDIAPRQIALELRIMEISKVDAQKVGLDWNILTGGTLQSVRINQGISGATSGAPGNITGNLGFAGGGTASLLSTLDSLATDRNLIARPNLIALDGRETELFIGDVVRYVESIQASQNGTTVTTGKVPVGIRFAVLPRIGGDGKITMDMRPVVSTLTGFTPVPGGGNLPQTAVRIAQSTVSMNSGETLALGGLISETDRKTIGGIPILKDLPLIGSLFRRVDKSKDRSEVVFFITAKVVDETNRANAAAPKKDDK